MGPPESGLIAISPVAVDKDSRYRIWVSENFPSRQLGELGLICPAALRLTSLLFAVIVCCHCLLCCLTWWPRSTHLV